MSTLDRRNIILSSEPEVNKYGDGSNNDIVEGYTAIYLNGTLVQPASSAVGGTSSTNMYRRFIRDSMFSGVSWQWMSQYKLKNTSTASDNTIWGNSATYRTYHFNNFTKYSDHRMWRIDGWFGGYTSSFYMKDLKLIFSDGASFTLKQAMTNQYIEPMVLISGGGNNTIGKSNYLAWYDGSPNPTGCNYHNFDIVFIVKEGKQLNEISPTIKMSTYWSADTERIAIYSVPTSTSNLTVIP